MEIAQHTAESVAQTNIETGAPRPDPSTGAADAQVFDDVVRAVQLAVSDATGIAGTLSLPCRCVDRATWSRTTLDGLSPVFAALADALARDGGPQMDMNDPASMTPEVLFGSMMQQLIPVLLGVWAGTMIGTLSHSALGQYDFPLPLDRDAELLLGLRPCLSHGASGLRHLLLHASAMRSALNHRRLPLLGDDLLLDLPLGSDGVEVEVPIRRRDRHAVLCGVLDRGCEVEVS